MKAKIKTAGAQAKRASSADTRAGAALPLAIKSILVPTDFSAPTRVALRQAVALAKTFGAKLTLLHVVEPVGPTPDFAYNPMIMQDEKLLKATRHHLDQLVVREGIAASSVERKLVVEGVPFHEIARTAASLKVDLIVVATHGYTGFAHVILGSTAERIVRHASCPVLVVRGEEADSRKS